MAKHVWSVLCRRAILDKNNNNVSLIDTLEGMEFMPNSAVEEGKQWHGLLFEAALVTFVTRSDYSKPEETKIKIQMISPSGQVHEESTVTDVSLLEHTRLRNFTFLQGLIFWSSGIHKFIISLQTENNEWEVVAEIPIDIQQKQKPNTN